jgi:hypothetical protein
LPQSCFSHLEFPLRQQKSCVILFPHYFVNTLCTHTLALY